MGYCSVAEVDAVLAQALTSATERKQGSPEVSQQRRNLLKIGSVRDSNLIPNDLVEQYIQWSGQEIDSSLGGIYKTPFPEITDFESEIFSEIDSNNKNIILEKSTPLSVGDSIVLIDGSYQERHSIGEIVAPNTFLTIEDISSDFSAGSRIIRIKFPDPIPFICSRLSAANIYEKYFAGQVGPQTSEYGKLMRNQAIQKINDVLNGRSILHGVHRIGRRLYDPYISDQYGLKEGQSQRDIDQLS